MCEIPQLSRYLLSVECCDKVREAERCGRTVAEHDVIVPLGTNGHRYGGIGEGGLWEWAAMRRSGGVTGVVGRRGARKADEGDDSVGGVNCTAGEPSVVCL